MLVDLAQDTIGVVPCWRSSTSSKTKKSSDMPWYDENTFVLRVTDIEQMKTFLECFGLSFVHEQHGDGPMHYSCVAEDKVFEIYPRKPRQAGIESPSTRTRTVQ